MSNESHSAHESTRPQDAHSQTPFAGEEWMTIDQVAEYFGCPATRVREWITDGVLTTRAAGSIELIQRKELDRIGNPDQDGAEAFENRSNDEAR